MEKPITLIFIFFFSAFIFAQDSLCVFNVKGTALVKIKNRTIPLKKGALLSDKVEILVTSPAEITLINSSGDAYKINRIGDYKFKDILSRTKIQNQKSLTSKYFKLIWDELLRKESGKTIIGGVFRGNVLMEFPKDSMKIASSKLNFKWEASEDSQIYYLFIKNLKTDEVFKLSSNGTELSLYKIQPIFSDGHEFEWTLSTSEFPNLNNMVFYRFKIITKNEYAVLKEKYSGLINDLMILGLTEHEIETSLCNTYGLCK